MVFKRRKISLYNGIFRINMKEFPLEIVVLSRYNFGVVNENMQEEIVCASIRFTKKKKSR